MKRSLAVVVVLLLPALAIAQQNNNNSNGNNAQRPDNGGWLGLAFVMESDKNRVVISELQPGGPAEQAELRVGDVITKVGSKTPKNAQDFANEVAKHNPGDKIMLIVLRDGKETKIEVTAGRRPNGFPQQ